MFAVPARLLQRHRERSTRLALLAQHFGRRHFALIALPLLQALQHLLGCWLFGNLADLAHEKIRKRQAAQSCACLQLPVERIRDVTQLNHLCHVLKSTRMCNTCPCAEISPSTGSTQPLSFGTRGVAPPALLSRLR